MTEVLLSIIGVLSSLLILFNGYVAFRTRKLEMEMKEQELKRVNDLDERDVKNEKKLETQIKLVIDRQEGTNQVLFQHSEKLEQISTDLKKHIDEENFKIDLQNTIQSTANHILFYNKNISNESYKMILWNWSNKIELFGINYYEVKHLNTDKSVFRSHLRQDIEILINEFYNEIDSKSTQIVKQGAKKVTFKSMLKEKNVHNKTYYLIETLADNGKTNEQLLSLFRGYINEFFDLFLTACASWDIMTMNQVNHD